LNITGIIYLGIKTIKKIPVEIIDSCTKEIEHSNNTGIYETNKTGEQKGKNRPDAIIALCVSKFKLDQNIIPDGRVEYGHGDNTHQKETANDSLEEDLAPMRLALVCFPQYHKIRGVVISQTNVADTPNENIENSNSDH
jgi:hypothetical protein